MKASRGLALLLFAFLLFSSSFARRLSSATGQETAIFDTPPPVLTIATPPLATTIATPPLATTIASPVLPDSYSSPVPPSPASPTLLTGLGVGFAVGVVAVAVAVLLIYCGKKNRQPLVPTPSAPHSSGMRIFTLDEINQCTNNFQTKLGEGTFGLVYHGRLSKEKEVAVKKLKGGDEQNDFGFETEVENLRRAHHKHVVSLVGYCKAESQCFLVYEYVPKKTLDFHLYGHGDGRQTLDWPTRLKIALGSAKGLAYLHEDCHPKIIHRDIKANNILLDSRFEAKIADFGLAKCIPESKSHVSTMPKGTPAYLDPEYSLKRKLTEKSDIYSFGVVLLELITGRKPTICAGSGECLVDWARSHLTRCLEARNFDSIADSRLGNNYERDEMARMVVCADACVRQSAKDRPKMSEIVRALEGYLPQRRPGESSDCGTSQALEMFRKILLASPEHGRGHDGEPTSGSSSAGPSRLTTQDLPMGRMQRDGQGFDGVSRSSLL